MWAFAGCCCCSGALGLLSWAWARPPVRCIVGIDCGCYNICLIQFRVLDWYIKHPAAAFKLIRDYVNISIKIVRQTHPKRLCQSSQLSSSFRYLLFILRIFYINFWHTYTYTVYSFVESTILIYVIPISHRDARGVHIVRTTDSMSFIWLWKGANLGLREIIVHISSPAFASI